MKDIRARHLAIIAGDASNAEMMEFVELVTDEESICAGGSRMGDLKPEEYLLVYDIAGKRLHLHLDTDGYYRTPDHLIHEILDAFGSGEPGEPDVLMNQLLGTIQCAHCGDRMKPTTDSEGPDFLGGICDACLLSPTGHRKDPLNLELLARKIMAKTSTEDEILLFIRLMNEADKRGEFPGSLLGAYELGGEVMNLNWDGDRYRLPGEPVPQWP